MEEKQMTLEEAFQKIDTLIDNMEKPELSLDEAFASYQEGLGLIRFCNAQIDQVEENMKILSEEGEEA